MASTYSTNLAIELIGTGDQAGSWGNTTNTNLGTLIEQAISGYVTQAVSTGTDTTITIPNGATGVARNMYIELTGTGGTNTNLIVPANKKLYFIFNNSTGAVTVKVSGQTGVSVPTGKKVVLTSNGTDVVNGLNYIADFASNSATITNLSATSATITNLTLTSLVISNLSIASANITTLTSASATITNLLGTTLTISGNTFLATSSGNVGIGTASPAAKLDVRGNATFTGNATARQTADFTNTGGQLYVGAESSAGGAVFTGSSAYAGILGTNTNTALQLATNGAVRATLDSSGNLGIGTASPSIFGLLAVVKDQTADTAIAVSNGGTSNAATTMSFALSESGIKQGWLRRYRDGSANTEIGFSDALLFTGNVTGTKAERARIDTSGNLGIGTTSPSDILTLAGGASGSYGLTINNAKVGGGTKAIFQYDATNAIALVGGNTTNGLAFQTLTGGSLTTKATIDASGQLGLGVTPRAWGGGYKSLDITGPGAIASTASGDTFTQVANGAWFNGTNWIYQYTSIGAARYQMTGPSGGGNHSWYVAGSGTAGNAISFTQAMTLDASGNLALGRTSVTTLGGGYRTVDLDGENGSGFRFRSNGTTIGVLYSSGTSYLDLATTGSYPLTFTTNNTERGRFSAGGFFKASNTGTYANATNDRYEFSSDKDDINIIVRTTSTGASVVNLYSQFPAGPNAGAYHFAGAIAGSGYQFTVDADGDVKNTNGSYAAISDLKLKQDIEDAASQWDDIKAVRVRKYRFKRTPDAPLQIGVVAQELEQTSPGLVSEDADRDEENNDLGTTTKSVKYSILYMKAIKALQEAMARIETLEAKVTALESK